MDFTLITKIDSAAKNLVSQGLLTDALKVYKQGLEMRINLYGADSEETVKFLGNVLKKVLRSSGELIDKGDVKLCIKSLKLLEKISAEYLETLFIPERCEIHNAMACAYKKLNKLELAQSELKSAIKYIRTHKEAQIDKASIYLNMCTVLSNLKKHKEAAAYGKRAVKAAQEDIINMKLGCSNKDRKIKLLAVAYHNLGVEEEFLKNYETALDWYKKAVSFLEKNCSRDHIKLLAEFQKTYESALKAFKIIRKKESISKKVEGRVSKLTNRFNSEHNLMSPNKNKANSRRESLIRTQSTTSMRASQDFKHAFTQHLFKDSPSFTSSLESSESSSDITDRSSSYSGQDLEDIQKFLDIQSNPSTARATRRLRGNRRIIMATREKNEDTDVDNDTRRSRPYSTDSKDFLHLMTLKSDITRSEPRTPENFAKLFSFAKKMQDSFKISSPKVEVSIIPNLAIKNEAKDFAEMYLKATIPPVTERSSNDEKSHSMDSDAKLPEEPPKIILSQNVKQSGRLFERVRPIIIPELDTPRNFEHQPPQKIPQTVMKEPPPLVRSTSKDSSVTTISTPVRSLSKMALIPKHLSIDASITPILPSVLPNPVPLEKSISCPPPSNSNPLHIIMEKTIKHLKYTLKITEEISTSDSQVDPRAAYIGGKNIVFEVYSQEDSHLPAPAYISESEVCEILDIQDARDISKRRESLLKYIDIYQNKIVINRRKKIPCQIKMLLYVTTRVLPVHGACKLYLYKYCKDADPILENMIIEVESLSDPSNQFEPFNISETELANVLGIEVEKMSEHYDDLANLIIIEGIFNIGISKRKPLGEDQSIMISILSPTEECKAPMLGSREIVMKEQIYPNREIQLTSNLKFIINVATKSCTRQFLSPPQDLEKAAIKIQSIFRGYKSRKSVSK